MKMVVFDMAGTILNEDNVVYKTLQKAINEAGYNLRLKKYWRKERAKKSGRP